MVDNIGDPVLIDFGGLSYTNFENLYVNYDYSFGQLL